MRVEQSRREEARIVTRGRFLKEYPRDGECRKQMDSLRTVRYFIERLYTTRELLNREQVITLLSSTIG